MSDPNPGAGPTRAAHGPSDPSRGAKIEQLLLAGLDHYFAGQYEHAINVWTRALFLDRSHARARAYIERARAAQAERQRQSEELLHHGADAFRRGEGTVARRLLRDAIDRGAPSDEAMSWLDRLDRIEHGPLAPPSAETPGVAPLGSEPLPHAAGRPRPVGAWKRVGLIAGLPLIVAATTLLGARWSTGSAPTGPSTPPITDETIELPLPRRGEAALTRARALAAGGRLHDAIRELESVRPTDIERAEADRLRADLQRQLLDLDRATSLRGPLP